MGSAGSVPLLGREELVGALVSARLGVLEAPGGFGKTTLGDQLAEHLGCATVRLTFDDRADADELVAELRRGLRAVGLSDAVAVVDGGGGLDDVLERLSGREEPTLVLVDEVQRLDAGAATALARSLRGLPPDVRVVLSGRDVPAALRRSADAPGAVALGADDLRFTDADVAVLLTARLGAAHAHLAGWLTDAVQGWPAATVLLLSVIEADPTRAVGSLGDGTAVIDGLLDDLLADLAPARRDALPTIATLPLFDARLLDELWGTGTLDALRAAGLSIRARGDGWLTMPEPVRDALAVRGSVDPAAIARAALHLAEGGHLAAAVQVLLDTADLDGLADLLAARPATDLRSIGTARLVATVGRLGDERAAALPELLVQAARAVDARDDDQRRQWLRRAEDLCAAPAGAVNGRPVLLRAVHAEQALDALRFDEVPRSVELATGALAGAAADEVRTRAQALMALGVAQILGDDSTHRARARPLLLEAAELFHQLDDAPAEAEALRRLGYSVELSEGSWEAATEVLGRALAVLRAPDRDRAILLTYCADVWEVVGRREEAVGALREAAEIAARLGDDRARFFVAWTAALHAAHAGDATEVAAQLAAADRASSAVAPDDANRFEYLLTVADAVSGMGDIDGARALVERARPHAQDVDRRTALQMVDARLEALAGDPVLAEELIAAIESAPRAVPQQHWIRVLELGVARLRAGDTEGAAARATEAFELAAAQGLPDLPQRIEPWMTSLLAPVVPAAAGASLPVRLALLGPLRLTEGSDDRTPPPGQPRALLALVAVRPSLSVDEAIDLLWPDVDLSTGRSRLRNLLNRLRERSGTVIERDGERLVLAADVHVDARVFERLADEALAAPAGERVGLARHALSHWAGEPLAEHRYEPWAAGPRERLRRRHLDLLDVVIEATLADDQLDEAIRHLEAAIEAEPLDEARHVQLITALIRQGRRSVARSALDHALSVVADLGVPPSKGLEQVTADLT